MKIGKVVLVLNGRYAGRKAVVVKVSKITSSLLKDYLKFLFTNTILVQYTMYLIIANDTIVLNSIDDVKSLTSITFAFILI